MKSNEMLKYKLSDKQTSTVFGEEAVILNYDKGEYYTLNEVGSVIWEELKNAPKSLPELVQSVVSEFDISETECSADIDQLLNNLLDEQLIEEVH